MKNLLQKIHEKRFLIRKRIIGLTLGIGVIWLFSSNVENDCIYVISHEIKNAHIQAALSTPIKDEEPKPVLKEKNIKIKFLTYKVQILLFQF